MKLKNLLLSVVSALISAFPIFADSDIVMTTLLVSVEGEETISLSLDDKPTITFTEQDCVISTERQELYFPLSTRIECSFASKESGVDSNMADRGISVTMYGKTMNIDGLTPDCELFIYDCNGLMVYRGAADDEGFISIDLSGFTAGIHVLKTNQLSYKFILK